MQLFSHTFDGRQSVLAETHDHHAAGHFPLAVEVGQATAQFRSQMHVCDILQTNRCAIIVDRYRDAVEVVQRLDIAQTAYHIFGFGHFDQPAADIVVGSLDSLPDLIQRDVVSQQGIRIDLYLILLNIPADCRYFRYTVDRLQRVAQIPVLQGP